MSSRASSIPAWPSLGPGALGRVQDRPPFPFSALRPVYFYAARYALHRIFRSLGLGPERKVLVPAYHHGNEVRAIRAAGVGVKFYPVERGLTVRIEHLERLCDGEVAAVLLVHYLGWPQPVRELRDLCRRRGVLLVEDCALALLGATERGEPLGSLGDYGVFCLYKTLPVPDGAVLVRNGDRAPEVGPPATKAPGALSVTARTSELVFHAVRRRSNRLGDALLGLKGLLGRSLDAAAVSRLPVGDDGFRDEATDTSASAFCRFLLPRFDYASIVRRRRENFLRLRDRLAGGASLLREDLPPGACPLFFPLLVEDKRAAAEALRARGVDVVEFWNTGDPEATASAFPQAHWLRRHVLELPLHQDVTPEDVEYMADQVLALRLRLVSDRVA